MAIKKRYTKDSLIALFTHLADIEDPEDMAIRLVNLATGSTDGFMEDAAHLAETFGLALEIDTTQPATPHPSICVLTNEDINAAWTHTMVKDGTPVDFVRRIQHLLFATDETQFLEWQIANIATFMEQNYPEAWKAMDVACGITDLIESRAKTRVEV